MVESILIGNYIKKKKIVRNRHFQPIISDNSIMLFTYMLRGDINKHFDDIETTTLGNMINKLRDLDYSDNKPLISKSDYNFLSQICANRNHWAHKVYTEFVYIENWGCSSKYEKQCEKLEKDRERVERAARILEDIRVDYCTSHKR